MIGTGEFSQVYLAVDIKPKRLFEPAVTATDKIPGTPQRQLASPRTSSPFDFPSPSGANSNRIFYAVKKSKTPYTGVRDRDRRLEEVRVLRELKGHDHVIRFVDSWEEDRFIYIQTEYCDNGSLDKFLDLHGSKGRLDEFRVWKVMIELLLVSTC